MNKLKHTPGPWEVKKGGNDINIIIMPEKANIGNGHKYATCGGMGDTEEREANVRLIASAPEMLECLIIIYKNFCSDCIETDCDWCSQKDKYRKIIEKATGMSIEDILKDEK